MVQYISPEQAPRQPLLARGDGLLDICLGFSLVVFAIGTALRISWLAIVPPTFIALIWLVLDHLLRPNLLTAAPRAQNRIKRLLIIPLFLFVLFALILTLLFYSGLVHAYLPSWVIGLFSTYHLFFGGALLAALLAAGGLLAGHSRYYLYALAAVILFAALDLAGTAVETPLFSLGLILIGGGGLVLLRGR